MISQDQLFLTIIRYAFLLMVVFGLSLAVALFFDLSDNIARALITAWSVMFTNTITMGAGYLVGKNNIDKSNDDDKS